MALRASECGAPAFWLTVFLRRVGGGTDQFCRSPGPQAHGALAQGSQMVPIFRKEAGNRQWSTGSGSQAPPEFQLHPRCCVTFTGPVPGPVSSSVGRVDSTSNMGCCKGQTFIIRVIMGSGLWSTGQWVTGVVHQCGQIRD